MLFGDVEWSLGDIKGLKLAFPPSTPPLQYLYVPQKTWGAILSA